MLHGALSGELKVTISSGRSAHTTRSFTRPDDIIVPGKYIIVHRAYKVICAPSTLPLALNEAIPALLEPLIKKRAARLSKLRQSGTAYELNSVVKGEQWEGVGLVEAGHPPQNVTEISYNAT